MSLDPNTSQRVRAQADGRATSTSENMSSLNGYSFQITSRQYALGNTLVKIQGVTKV